MALISLFSSQLFSFKNYLHEIAQVGTLEDINHFCAVEAYRIVYHVLDILIDIKSPNIILVVLDFFEIINRDFYFSNLSMFDEEKINKIISMFFTGIKIDCHNYTISIDIKTLEKSMTGPSKI